MILYTIITIFIKIVIKLKNSVHIIKIFLFSSLTYKFNRVLPNKFPIHITI